MKLKQITFHFENCECLTVDGKYIGEFRVDKLRTSICRIACNAINRMDVAGRVVIEIHKNANNEHHPFGQNDLTDTVFNRLCYGDITSIDFELIDSYSKNNTEKYSYYVDWIGDNDYKNEAQHTYISDLGHLYLVICKDEHIENHFDMNDINDKDYMDFYFKMLDVG